MTGRAGRRSPLAMVLLALLAEAPMHPYRMQQLIKARGKDTVVNVAQRNSVYQTIDRLLRSGLIAMHDTSRAENRPERNVYRITEEGQATLYEWLRVMLSEPAREFPEFPAALATVALLTPEEVLGYLQARADAQRSRLASPPENPAGLPRLFRLEQEYARAVVAAELAWLDDVIADLQAGRLTWDDEVIRRYAAS